MNKIQDLNSIIEASNFLNMSQSNIKAVLQKTAGGFF